MFFSFYKIVKKKIFLKIKKSKRKISTNERIIKLVKNKIIFVQNLQNFIFFIRERSHKIPKKRDVFVSNYFDTMTGESVL